MEAVLAELEKDAGPPSATVRQGHLALLKRWYYRPEVKREGEVCFPERRWTVADQVNAAERGAGGGKVSGTCGTHVAQCLTKVGDGQGEDDPRDARTGQPA